MKIMQSLHAKLSFGLAALLLSLGVIILSFGYRLMNDYHQELTQELNKDIAMYINDACQFMQGKNDDDAILRELAEQTMSINPTLEVYLLDTYGNIVLNIQGPEADIKQPVIDLAPLHKFIAGEARFPIRAADPLNANVEKIFAAHEIRKGGVLQGYVYVILGGRLYDTIADRTGSSYVLQTFLWCLPLLLLLSAVLGMVLFKTLTARLYNLVGAVKDLAPEQAEAGQRVLQPREEKDEIDVLHNTLFRMESKINQQINSLKDADLQRRELVSNISHDLRTPLATMMGYIETLLIKGDKVSATDRVNYLQTTQRSAQRLNGLISDLFELSRLESGQADLQKESFSIMELIHDTMQEFEVIASQKNIQLYMPSPNQDIRVFADIGLIQRVLANLLNNAIRFTPVDGSISIGFKLHDNQISVMVRDTGPGIPQQEIPKIFERHYSAENVTGSISSGLGLSIVTKILELHNSSLSVDANIRKGSSFCFCLPVAANMV